MAKTIESISIGFKLDGKNFPIWSKLMLVAVGSRDKLHHLEGDTVPPKSDDPTFKGWQAADYTVFSWLIQNMEPRLIMQFAQHQTAKAMWKSLVTTFGVRADPKLWINIDAQKPCPYTCCEKGIDTYRKETEIKRLYQFLAGLHDKYDSLRREILKLGDNTTADEAFGIVKQEEGRTVVWKPAIKPIADSGEAGIGAGFGVRFRQPPPPVQNRAPAPPHARDQQPTGYQQNRTPKIDKSKLYCTHCGMNKHTMETCFKRIGYPEWWEDGHKLNRNGTAKGKSAVEREETVGVVATAGSQKATYAGDDTAMTIGTPIGGGWWPAGTDSGEAEAEVAKAKCGIANEVDPSLARICHVQTTGGKKDRRWIFDCGATDTMTYSDGNDYWAWH
ncbi:hypothetical protein AAHA92_16033 [Salvia divinorum]|uniref:Retrotransposon Copia-like N-terminal domain-containing protein n=1 Tax=Salvia divinorum TaxID=28513 RepID=A0ABD1GX59_SALDI